MIYGSKNLFYFETCCFNGMYFDSYTQKQSGKSMSRPEAGWQRVRLTPRIYWLEALRRARIDACVCACVGIDAVSKHSIGPRPCLLQYCGERAELLIVSYLLLVLRSA